MKKFLALTAFVTTATLAAVAPAMSQTASGSIAVTTTFAASCIAPTTATAPVTYDGINPGSGTSTFSYKCTKNTPVTVSVGTGGNLIGTGTNPDTLPYTASVTAGALGTGNGLSAGATALNATATIAVPVKDVTPDTYSTNLPITLTY
jgi:hypothetical protein